MREYFTTKKSLFFLFICLFGGGLTLTAQPNMTIWHVNQAHVDNPEEGFATFWSCGYEYYIFHTGTASSRDFLMEIKNEGNEPLNLTLPLSLSAGSHSDFTIISQPTKSTLGPNEETLVTVRYTAPATYNDAEASLLIPSNDPNQANCSISFEVGASFEPLSLLCDGTEVSQSVPINMGTVNLGACSDGPITKTFTIRSNDEDNTLNLTSSCGNSDIVSIITSGLVTATPSFPSDGEILINFIDVAANGATATLSDFTVTTQPASSIDPSGTTTFVVSFNPSSLGEQSATLCFDASIGAADGTSEWVPAAGFTFTYTLTGTAESCPVTFDSNNNLTFGDPCKCDDPLNCTSGGTTYFHDTLTIPASGNLASGLDLRITSATNFLIDVPCNGGTLTAPTPSTGAGNGTQITEVGTSGVYKLEFWRPSGAQPTLSVSEGGNTAVAAPAATFQPICTVEACTPQAPIPTMSEWGLIIFGLLVLNLGMFFMYKKEEVLNF